MRRSLRAFVFTFAALAGPAVGVWAEDFRIKTKVYQGQETAPAYQNLTLFSNGAVYDFLGEPASEVTIYDPRQGHFWLLDVKQSIKTRIQREVLLQFVAGIQARAAERGDAILREAAQPQFQIEEDALQRRLALRGKRIHYVAHAGESFPSPAAARQYFDFVDMYARLNATRPGELPPLSRLELNAELARREWLPTKIERNLQPQRRLFGRMNTARSEHTVAWQLLQGDQKRIDAAARQLSDFKSVTFSEYRGLDAAR